MSHKKFEDLGINKRKKREYEELSYLVAFVYNTISGRVEKMLRQNKISLARFNILLILKYKGGDSGLSQTGITKSLIVSDGNITRVLDRMEKEKLIIRDNDPGDRRTNIIRISLNGSDLIEKLWPVYDRIIKESLSVITSVEQKKMIKTFYKIALPLTQ